MLGDFLHGVRMVRRSPGVAATAILLVALGAGANAAIFAVARTLVYRPLPFDDPDRLVALWRESADGTGRFGASWPHLAEWRANRRLFQGAAAYLYSSTYSSGTGSGGVSGPVAEFRVTDGFFSVLGVRAFRGRLLAADEFRPDTGARLAMPVVVSHEFWSERLGSAPDALGRRVDFDARTGIVVGILPAGVRLFRTDVPEVYTPFRDVPDHYADRGMTYLDVFARTQPGVRIGQVRAELTAWSRRAAAEHPESDAGLTWKAEGLHDRWFGSKRPVMAVLLLVRTAERRGEIAIRRALGAGSVRMARHLLAESLVLAVAGGGAGLLMAAWATDLFSTLSLGLGLDLPAVRIDAAVAGFTLLVAITAGLLFGTAPILAARRIDLNASLKAGGPTLTTGLLSDRAAGGLIAAEIAISTLLLIGAGLLLRTFVLLNGVDPGFRRDAAIALSIGRTPGGENLGARERLFWSQLLERTRALPAIDGVAMCGALPLASEQAPENMKARVVPEGQVLSPPGYLEAEFQDVSADYFRVMGIPFKSGRPFGSAAADAHAVIVNESFARETGGVGTAMGRRLTVPGGRPSVIVGVVGDVRQYSLRSGQRLRQVYRPLWPSDLATLRRWPSQYLVVRSRDPRPELASLVKAAVNSVDPERAVVSVRTLEEVAAGNTAWDRLKMDVVALFGGTALLLTLVGLYGVLAQTVSRRRREIATRMALGGQPGDIGRMVLVRGARLIAGGLIVGLVAAAGLTRLVASQLFEVGPLDVATYASVTILVAGAALAACCLPLRRASRMDPSVVLRAE